MEKWAINSAAVAAETFEDETVVIHFESGRYFSLGGTASWIWQAMQEPASLDEIAAAAPDHREEMESFVTRLRDEGLIVAAADAGARTLPPPPAGWQTPSIEAFSDLSELIALDPVHEVDAAMGWPRRAPDQA